MIYCLRETLETASMSDMEQADHDPDIDPIAEGMYQPILASSWGESSEMGELSNDEISQIGRLMRALANLRDREREILEASEKYMKLSSQDMRALHYLISAKSINQVVTPSMIAAHLKISPASTTKILNRLEQGGHVVRRMHPTDRRAFVIDITPQTEASARQTIGKQHAKRTHAASRLSPSEREVVIRFLEEMADDVSIVNADWAR